MPGAWGEQQEALGEGTGVGGQVRGSGECQGPGPVGREVDRLSLCRISIQSERVRRLIYLYVDYIKPIITSVRSVHPLSILLHSEWVSSCGTS